MKDLHIYLASSFVINFQFLKNLFEAKNTLLKYIESIT